MLGGRSKVAPLKPICIQRLEWNAALLLSRFIAILCNCLKDHVINVYAWTDSQVVLSWLSSPLRNWKAFVANRTSAILDFIPCKKWLHVSSKEKPADLGSKGMSPKDLPDCSLWWEGPQWLSNEGDWSRQTLLKDIKKSVIIETKKTFVFSVYCKNIIIDLLFNNHLSFSKIINILAFCLRFLKHCKDVKNKKRSIRKMKPLTIREIIVASSMVILCVENVYFNSEIKCLKLKQSLPGKNPLAVLCSFIDEDGLIRVGVGEEIKGSPETVEESKLTLKGRWDIVQKLKLNFWKRWQMDYLNSIQGRTKWKSGTSNIKIGDVVIIKEDNLPPSVWPLGKVISTHPALVICSVTSDDANNNYGIDASFFKKEGLSTLCSGNQTFGSYQRCTKTCEQMTYPDDCPDKTAHKNHYRSYTPDVTLICIGS
ncbi:DUF5641 domain-containing protein [Trichonephila clavipes]|nr:DUF5641 domain-containing protein [Trichonephila clavipes]